MGNEKQLAKAMYITLADDALREKMGQWNRARVLEAHAWPAIASQLYSVYAKLVSRNGKHSKLESV